MDLGLKEKVVLITGGSLGIGRATAPAFAAEGASVAICGRRQAELDAAVSIVRKNGGRVAAVPADVTDPKDAERVVRACVAELGGLDILINNVGAGFGAPKLVDSTDEEWQKTFEVSFFQAVRLMRHAVPPIATRGGGAIVNISSISGWSAQLAGRGQYGAAKAALIFDTERWALEFVPDRIRVNTVSPGSILCDGTGWDVVRQEKPEIFADYLRDGFPMGRLGTPEEVADVIVFLASPRAHWINGRNIPVDGLQQPIPRRDLKPY